MTQPLFFQVNEGATVRFINAAHVVQIEIDSATKNGGTLHLQDGSKIEFGANEADWIMRLMARAKHEEGQAIGALYKGNK